jgi:GIY-YIG catalytic domain
MADFRPQRGIYILYGNHGAYYAGLTRQQTLGKRLRDHLQDEHDGNWDRFSWFGFKPVLKKKDKFGLRALKTTMPQQKSINTHTSIKEMEALLIKAMALKNRIDSKFIAAEEWYQVRLIDKDKLLEKLR